MNWIVPKKFLAFKSPANQRIVQHGFVQLAPEDYMPLFRKWGISAIVRFNKRVYDRKKFVDNGLQHDDLQTGFNHFDLFFVDGGLPSEAILKKFFDIVDKEQAIAYVLVY